MREIVKVLIVEDEPLIIDAYVNALKGTSVIDNTAMFNIDSATNIDEAIHKLTNSQDSDHFNIVFLDIRVPKSKSGAILCGEDLGIEIKKSFKNTKIIVSTSYNDAYRISAILKNLNPEGFLVKGDLNMTILIDAIKTVVSGDTYYSRTVAKVFKKLSANNFTLDQIDKKMLYELSIGAKMNDLPKILPLSLAALERRKRILKDVFNVEGNGNRDLLRAAKERGFI